jgi:phage terminase large subunit-like protein
MTLILTPRPEAGKLERLVYERAQRDHARPYHPIDWPYRFEPRRVERVIRFLERHIRLSEGEWAGQPIKLFPVHRFIIQEVYGWVRDDGTRRFSSAYITMARKCAKTTINSGLCLYHLTGDQEFTGGAPQVYSAGVTQAQAGLSYTIAKRMVRLSKALKKTLEVQGGHTIDKAQIYNKDNFGFFKALASDAGSLEGLSGSFLLFDELSAWKNRDLIDVLESSTGARKSPLAISITTAGVFDTERIGWQRFEIARQIAESVVLDEGQFVFIATADPDLPYDSLKAWQQAHPTPEGTTPTEHYRKTRTAKALTSNAEMIAFRRFDLNQWVDAENQAINIAEWRACITEGDVDVKLKALPVVLAFDLSQSIDLTSVTWIGTEVLDGLRHYHVKSHSWLPDEMLQKHIKEGRRFWQQWADAGWITIVDGAVINYAEVGQYIISNAEGLQVQHVCYDPRYATHLAQDLEEKGFSLVVVPQKPASLNAACREFEAAVKMKRVHHYGPDPVLAYAVNSLNWKTNQAGEVIPAGGHNVQGKRIDPVAALITALTMGMLETGDLPVISGFKLR